MVINIKCDSPTKMLPNCNPRTVFINPNFKNTHINPNFLISKPASSIHVNPEFLQKLQASANVPKILPTKEKRCQSTNNLTRIISKSKMKIVRAPVKDQNQTSVVRVPMRTQGQTSVVGAPVRAQSQPNVVRSPERGPQRAESPTSLVSALVRAQSPTSVVRALVRAQSPTNVVRALVRAQSPTSVVRALLRAQSEASVAESPLRAQREASMVEVPVRAQNQPSVARAQNQTNVVARSPLVKIGLRKLVRASTVLSSQAKKTIPALASSPVKKGRYKIDRRIMKKIVYPKKLGRKSEFVSKYALRRVNMDESLRTKRIVITKRRLLKIGQGHLSYMKSKFPSASVNKKLELLNINGVLYKSSRTKLQKTDTKSKSVEAFRPPTSGRVLFVRGDKFILDKSGFSLTRVEKPHYSKMSLKRIDIGGLTYVAKSNNVFIRTDVHKTRNHLSIAKQKSINTLSKNLVKTNIPCAIFRKVGKCAACDRGKCPKVHDRIQVSICPKFLKGECSNEKCLLSHNVSLSKMPTCKFFLQGCCVRENCPYLHKKLSDSTQICIDFLRGFCSRADKCNQRHEFRCPDYEITGKCEKIKCVYCRKNRKPMQVSDLSQKQNKIKEPQISHEINLDNEEKQGVSRYFVEEPELKQSNIDEVIIEHRDVADDLDANTKNNGVAVIRKRPKLGVLPAFIPL